MNSRLSCVPLIPRACIFGNPANAHPQIEPNGLRLAWLAPQHGVVNIWVAPIDRLHDARPVTNAGTRGVGLYAWTYLPEHLVYLHDAEGDENYHIHCVNTETGIDRDLTPFAGVRSTIVAISRECPGQILIMCNKRSLEHFDLYNLDLQSGQYVHVLENPGFISFVLDGLYQPRFATRLADTGELEILRYQGAQGWSPWLSFPIEDVRVSRALMLAKDGKRLFLLDSRQRDTAALTCVDLESGHVQVIAEDAGADISDLHFDLVTQEPILYGVTRERRRYTALNADIQVDIDFLAASGITDWQLINRSRDDRLWIISTCIDCRPPTIQLYDRNTRLLTTVMSAEAYFDTSTLVPMQCVSFCARDGRALIAYLTRPPATTACGPMVLLVHGGPWARDEYGFNSYHQWLANRGYNVMSVNFRGSTGLGKTFINAGDGEWGRKMDDDLLDAVEWAVCDGVADPMRVAIMGVSYGGYAVLAGMTRSPDRYACGVDLCGPTNLETFIDSIPVYWASLRSAFIQAIGDPRTTAGLALLRERSPIHHVCTLTKPLLVGHGAHDVRVRRNESDQLCEALRANDIPVTYLLFPDEGHGLQRPGNMLYFNAVVETFLARYLGGRAEPISDEERSNSSAQYLIQAEDDCR